MSATPATGQQDTQSSRFRKVVAYLSEASRAGELASLRRLHPDRLDASAFWVIVTRFLERADETGVARPLSNDNLRRWATILTGLAHVIKVQPAKPDRRTHALGHALASANVHEQRLLRLLRAHSDQLHDALIPLAHHLVAKNQAVDWWWAAKLVLSDGQTWAAETRQRIARDYYASLSAK